MKAVDILATILLVVGALNWGLVGAFNFNLVTALFGVSALSSLVFVLVGLAAVYFIVRWATAPREMGIVHHA